MAGISPERTLLLERLIQAYAVPSGCDPEEHGYVVLIEPRDVYRQRILPELPCPLADVPWEGVTLRLCPIIPGAGLHYA